MSTGRRPARRIRLDLQEWGSVIAAMSALGQGSYRPCFCGGNAGLTRPFRRAMGGSNATTVTQVTQPGPGRQAGCESIDERNGAESDCETGDTKLDLPPKGPDQRLAAVAYVRLRFSRAHPEMACLPAGTSALDMGFSVHLEWRKKRGVTRPAPRELAIPGFLEERC